MNIQLIDKMGGDLSVVNAARVSFAKKKDVLDQSDEKLIKYLADHDHWSPFGHTTLQFLIKAPVFVARQLVKHQVGLVWNEVSRRYVNTKPNWYRPTDKGSATWRYQTEDKKQGSGGEITDENISTLAALELNVIIADAMTAYEKLLSMGVCEEQARMVLPLCHLTEWWWSGSLDAFSNMCILRCAKDAQKETRLVADQISSILGRIFPVSWKELMNAPKK